MTKYESSNILLLDKDSLINKRKLRTSPKQTIKEDYIQSNIRINPIFHERIKKPALKLKTSKRKENKETPQNEEEESKLPIYSRGNPYNPQNRCKENHFKLKFQRNQKFQQERIQFLNLEQI